MSGNDSLRAFCRCAYFFMLPQVSDGISVLVHIHLIGKVNGVCMPVVVELPRCLLTVHEADGKLATFEGLRPYLMVSLSHCTRT